MTGRRTRRGARGAGLAVLACAAALAAASVATAQMPPATPVRAVEIEEHDLQERRKVTGELRAVARAQVATIEQGLVMELPITEGQVVRAGDVLAQLDRRRLEIALRQLEAEQRVADATLAARAAELELKERDLEALSALHERRASNPKELADAGSDVRIASARRDAAKLDLDVLAARADLVGTRLEDTAVTAPFDGIVIRKHTERGEWIGQGDAVAEIVSVGSYDAWLDVPQRYAEALGADGIEVSVRIDATGTSVAAARPTLVPRVDSIARTFSVHLRVEDPSGVLAPGMSVTGWVPTGARRPYLTVPRDALLRNPAGFYVYAVRSGPEGATVAAPIPVTAAFETRAGVAVAGGGLVAGDLVVVEGNERLFPMMPIAVEVVAPAPSPAPAEREARGGRDRPAGPGGT